MEFLKALFDSGALTWEQFQDAAKKAGFEVVNAAGGAYVPKADLDTQPQQLTAANNTISQLRETAKKWDGKDPQKLESDLKALQIKYDTDMESIRKGAAVDLALTKARARDTAIACAALNLDEVKLDKDGKVAGLDAQLETLKKDKAWLFEDAQQPESSGKPPYTPPEGGSPNTVTDMASALAEHYK